MTARTLQYYFYFEDNSTKNGARYRLYMKDTKRKPEMTQDLEQSVVSIVRPKLGTQCVIDRAPKTWNTVCYRSSTQDMEHSVLLIENQTYATQCVIDWAPNKLKPRAIPARKYNIRIWSSFVQIVALISD